MSFLLLVAVDHNRYQESHHKGDCNADQVLGQVVGGDEDAEHTRDAGRDADPYFESCAGTVPAQIPPSCWFLEEPGGGAD